jgi:peptide/nickel transport system substrate-binding protein
VKRTLALVMCLTLMAAMAVIPAAAAATGPADSLIVGSTTQMSGSFFTGMWGNNTADIDVRGLLHDYQTIAWTSTGIYTVNSTAVSNLAVTATADGGRQYLFTLNNDLRYSDGTAVTAKDYVFSVLLQSSPQAAEIGGNITSQSHFVGYEAYAGGQSAVFSGVRLLGEYSFSLRVGGEFLPYYYELAFANVTPYPLAVIAPGCDVADDGNGAYITGGFTAELLKGTILDPVTGYLSHPAVTTGAYKLTSYDAAARVAEFEINGNYKGNYEGQKPSIAKLTFREVKNDTMLDELANGTVGLINKVSSGEVIAKGQAMALAQQANMINYLRTGLSFIAFATEQGPAQSVKLRQAVAHSVDVQALCDEFLLGNGVPVYGYYGYGQWMIAPLQARLEELNLYKPDTDAAAALLAEDGWNVNKDGNAYDAAADTQRYRLSNGVLEPLTLKMAIPGDNAAANIVVKMLKGSFEKIGAVLEVTEMETNELLAHYYRQTDRVYDMFFLATNFTYIFDPYYTYNTADEYQGAMNTSGLRDEQLMNLAKDLRETESNDMQGYLDKWMNFQLYWAQVLPCVPLYSNMYFDISRVDLNNYFANNYWSWSVAILYATLGAPAATTAP